MPAVVRAESGVTEESPRPHRDRRARQQAQDRRFGYAMVAPAVLTLLAITGYPLFYSLWNSFHNMNYLAPPVGKFVGIDNYKTIFTNDSFMPALVRTVVFTVVSVAIELAIGLVVALVLDHPFRGRGFVRAAVFVPWAVPTVVSAELWKTMFDPQQGFVNYALSLLHLPLAHTTWLNQPLTAWTAIFVADAWKNTPFVAILLLAGLQVIPRDIYQAARMDGASSWGIFTRITLPLLKPSLMVALIFRTLSAFMMFDIVYIMTGGGPGDATTVLGFLNWQAFLVNSDFGLGGAVSVVLVVMALMTAGLYVRAFRIDDEVLSR